MLDFIPPDIWDTLFIALRYAYKLLPLILFVSLSITLWNAWLDYRRAFYWNKKLGYTLLEIKLPKDIMKSPLAMEVVLNQIHQTGGEGNWYQKYWLGQTRDWFSLEIVSTEGQIHFYIWTRKKHKNGIEAHLYSQYPGVEIYEVEDYIKNFYYDPSKHNMFACQWVLTEPDPYPIGTYVDYGLDKDPKEELKTDPMTSQLEILGTVQSKQHIWIQILVRAHKKEQPKPGTWFEKRDAWKDESKAQIENIIKGLKKEESSFPRIPTKGEAERIAALERSIGKIGFDVSIRSIYFAEKDAFNPIYIGSMLGSFKQYGAMGLNGFKPSGLMFEYNDFWWFDWWKFDKDKMAKIALEEYKLRSFFFSPYKNKWFYTKPFVLNSEELATIFHLPGAVAGTPTFERLPSRKSDAPSNLPL